MEEISQGMLEDMIDSDQTLVVDFYASWCGPCKMMHPVIEKEGEKHKNVKFVRVNVEDAYDFCEKNNIASIPTIIVYKNKKETNRTMGLMSSDDFHQFIELSINQ
ncbi:MAG: thioredoxin [Clostridia bacterium]|nr:thioredoxin [Clostridia bacterium]